MRKYISYSFNIIIINTYTKQNAEEKNIKKLSYLILKQWQKYKNCILQHQNVVTAFTKII